MEETPVMSKESVSEKVESSSKEESVDSSETFDTSEPIDYEWGVPLFLKDSEYLEEWSSKRHSNEGSEVLEKTDRTLQLGSTIPSSEDFVDSLVERVPVRLAAVVENNFFLAKKHSSKHYCKKRYLNIKEPSKPRPIPLEVTIDFSAVSPKWEKDINLALRAIQEAAPGLLFSEIRSSSADIYVDREPNPDKDSNTKGSLRSPRKYFRGEIKSRSLIRLDYHLESLMRYTVATHEILHALGFQHEHQRSDAGLFLEVFKEYRFHGDVMANPFFKPLTPFDPFSIMLYKTGDFYSMRDGKKYDNKYMSEWDKIALNSTFPPARVEGFYEPILVPETGMYYCGRQIMNNHNQPAPHIVTSCGQPRVSNQDSESNPDHDPSYDQDIFPGSGPNCPACRVLSRPCNLGDDRWQGRSGFVYCGNNGCGPDINEPCDDCGNIINYR